MVNYEKGFIVPRSGYRQMLLDSSKSVGNFIKNPTSKIAEIIGDDLAYALMRGKGSKLTGQDKLGKIYTNSYTADTASQKIQGALSGATKAKAGFKMPNILEFAKGKGPLMGTTIGYVFTGMQAKNLYDDAKKWDALAEQEMNKGNMELAERYKSVADHKRSRLKYLTGGSAGSLGLGTALSFVPHPVVASAGRTLSYASPLIGSMASLIPGLLAEEKTPYTGEPGSKVDDNNGYDNSYNNTFVGSNPSKIKKSNLVNEDIAKKLNALNNASNAGGRINSDSNDNANSTDYNQLLGMLDYWKNTQQLYDPYKRELKQYRSNYPYEYGQQRATDYYLGGLSQLNGGNGLNAVIGKYGPTDRDQNMLSLQKTLADEEVKQRNDFINLLGNMSVAEQAGLNPLTAMADDKYSKNILNYIDTRYKMDKREEIKQMEMSMKFKIAQLQTEAKIDIENGKLEEANRKLQLAERLNREKNLVSLTNGTIFGDNPIDPYSIMNMLGYVNQAPANQPVSTPSRTTNERVQNRANVSTSKAKGLTKEQIDKYVRGN